MHHFQRKWQTSKETFSAFEWAHKNFVQIEPDGNIHLDTLNSHIPTRLT
jgi:hypothetical protein